MCQPIGHHLYPQGKRCPKHSPERRALTYTEQKLDATVEQFVEQVAVPAPAPDAPTELSKSWIKRLFEAAVAVQRKIIAHREKRQAIRAAREAQEAERIAAIEEESERKAAEAREKKHQALINAYDKTFDYARQAYLDLQMLKDSTHPGGVARRKMLLEEAKREAEEAARDQARLDALVPADVPYTESQSKRAVTAFNKQRAASALVASLELAIAEAPTLDAAIMRNGRAKGAFERAEAELDAFENVNNELTN